jgi:hypothetical protein
MQTTGCMRNLRCVILAAFSLGLANLCQAQWTLPTADNPTFWVKGDSGVTTGGGVVTGWTDQMGNFNLGNDVAGTEPTIGSIGGVQAVHFDGNDDRLINSNVNGSSLISPGEGTVFIVQNNGGGNPNSASFGWYAGNDQAGINADFGSTIYYAHGNVGSAGSTISTPSPGDFYTRPEILTFERATSGSGLIRISGDERTGSFNAGNTANTAQTGTIVLGGIQASGFSLNGDIAEVIVFKTALSEGDISTVENYLGTKYGISVVPEPSQYATAFALACLVGAIVIRRKRQMTSRTISL